MTSKINGYQAPYRSLTFRQMTDALVGRNGVLKLDGEVTQSGLNVSVPAFTVVQQGMIYNRTYATSVATPSLPAPYYLTVSAPTPGKVEDLIFSYAKGPEDLTELQVALAIFDGLEWRPVPVISIDGIIEQRYLENVETHRTGPYSGLKTSIDGTDYVTSAGILIDKHGQLQDFTDEARNPIIEVDPDWPRVDRILYRRAVDDENRIGAREFLLGGTYVSPAAKLYTTAWLDNSVTRNYFKAVVTSDNSLHLFCTSGSAGSYALTYVKVASDRQTIVVSPVDIIASVSEVEFDAIVDDTDTIHVVYISGGDVLYQRVSDTGTLVGSANTIDTQTGACKKPRCKLDAGFFKLYVVYQAVVGANNQIFFTSYNVSTNTVASTPRQITESEGVSTQNLTSPDLWITSDYLMYVAWENTTLTSIQYRRFDDIAVAIDAAPITVSSGVTRIDYGSSLTGGAKNPRIVVSGNEVPHIAFLQNKGSSLYGISLWTPERAFMKEFFGVSENFTSFDFYLESIFNGPTFVVTRSTSTDVVKMQEDYLSFTINLSVGAATSVTVTKDRLGSMAAAWTDSTGGHSAKTPGEALDMAFSHKELASDILLARLVPADPVGSSLVLNWVLNGKPGSFYDFLLAHGDAVVMDWELAGPNIFHLGAGLKVLDMYSDTDYTVAAGDYTLPVGSAIFVRCDGLTLSVTPEVLPISMLPWDEDIAVLGLNKLGKFDPVLLGVAGMEQLDSEESIIFGEDLPQNIRARLGIVSEIAYELYTSTIGISNTESYATALSNLDIMSGQNRHVRLVRLDAEWSVEAVGTLRINSSAYVQIPGLAEARNEIQAQAISLTTDGQVAYVSLNRTSGAAAQLAVSVSAISSLAPTRNTFILARRVGSDLIIDSLGALFVPGTLISSERSADKRDAAYADVVDFTTTILPTGTAFSVDGYPLVDGSRVLFAHEDLDGIYQVNGVGVALSWTKIPEFNGDTDAQHNDTCHIGDLGSDPDHSIIWRYDENNVVGDTRWVPAVLSESNKLYLGLDANDVHKDGGEYQDQLIVGQLNNIVREGDSLEKAIKRLDVRPDVVKRARVITRTALSLPTIAPVVIDGVTLSDGDKVLFAAPILNGIYQLVDIGYGISWTKLYEFAGSQDPSDQSLVMIYDGAEINRTIWAYDDIKSWYRATTIDDTVPVRAADFTTTSLPSGVSLTVDGQSILEGELVLYGNAALNRVYRVTGIGSSIIFEEMNVFMGEEAPRDGSSVLAQDGTVSDVVYEYDADSGSWHYLTLTYQNKTYLGLTSPSKAGGTFVDQVSPGQINNVVVEGDILEEAIKRLDIRPDVLKPVRAIDLTATVLPSGSSAVVDGVTLVNGDKVLFGNASLNGIYQISGVGSVISWTKLYEFAGLQTPTSHSVVLVKEGTELNRTVWQYDSAISPPWHRLAGPPAAIWTGPDAVTAPSFDGMLSTDDTDMSKVLETVDKYFRSLQLREHPTNKARVKILADGTVKTDGTILNNIIGDKLLAFDGAELDFSSLTSVSLYASDGVTLLQTFGAFPIPTGDYFWYAIGFDNTTALSNNTVFPTFILDAASTSDSNQLLARRPNLTAEYIIGAVELKGSGTTPEVDPIYQGALTQISQHNNAAIFADIAALQAIVAIHTDEINDLQNAIATVLANRPDFEVFTAGPGGQSVFNLTRFQVNSDNTILDSYAMWNGRYQNLSRLGDFSDGGWRKNSATQVELAETLPEGEEVTIYIWDPAALLVRTTKEQVFVAPYGGQKIFDLDPLVFTVANDNTVIDCEYYIDGRWQNQSLLGDFTDGGVRKNSITEIELAETLPEGKSLTVVRRVPIGGSGGGGGGGGSTDLENITVNLGFVTPKTVGTLAKPADALILQDQDNSDVWRIEIASGSLQIIKL